MLHRKLVYILTLVELFIAWCFWMLYAVHAGYIPGSRGGWHIFRCFELRKEIEAMPYDALLALAKNKNHTEPPDISATKEELFFFAFMMHANIRQSLHAFMICLALFIAVAMGCDWLILYLAAAAAFLFGILRLVQGCMEIA